MPCSNEGLDNIWTKRGRRPQTSTSMNIEGPRAQAPRTRTIFEDPQKVRLLLAIFVTS
jgi:hypothetical protein